MPDKLQIGFSPCPNDTFIFDAMIHQKVNTYGLEFVPVIEDVQQLNDRAKSGMIAITKMSFFAYAAVADKYKILNAGSALGKNCGPLLVSGQNYSVAELSGKSIAIPGINTTANLLLSIFFPQLVNKTPLLFSEIEQAVIDNRFDAGLIIHESRFTYEQKGLKKIVDLGEKWEQATGKPIPLGCICVSRDIDTTVMKQIDDALKSSVEFAFANNQSVMPFVKIHAQEMDENVMQQHINLYVNDFTLDLGNKGKDAIRFLFEKALEAKMIDKMPADIFVS